MPYVTRTTYALTNKPRIRKGKIIAGIGIILFSAGLILFLVSYLQGNPICPTYDSDCHDPCPAWDPNCGHTPAPTVDPLTQIFMFYTSMALVLVGLILACIGGIYNRAGMTKLASETYYR